MTKFSHFSNNWFCPAQMLVGSTLWPLGLVIFLRFSNIKTLATSHSNILIHFSGGCPILECRRNCWIEMYKYWTHYFHDNFNVESGLILQSNAVDIRLRQRKTATIKYCKYIIIKLDCSLYIMTEDDLTHFGIQNNSHFFLTNLLMPTTNTTACFDCKYTTQN